MNSFTLQIDDESIEKRFQAYLKGKAVKYFPFYVIQSLTILVIASIRFGFSIQLMPYSFYFICSVIGVLMARRHSWTASYFALFLTELGIILAIMHHFWL